MRNGASDYLLKNNLARLVPALMHAVEATADAPRPRARRPRAGQVQAAPARAGPAPADQHRAGARRHRARDPRRRRRLADRAEVRPGLDRAPRHRRRRAAAGQLGAGDGDARHRVQPAHHAQPAPGDPGAGPGGGAAVDRLALREAHRHRLRVAHCRRRRPSWPAGVPLVAYRTAQEALTNVSKHAQRHAGADRPVAGRRRDVAGNQRQRPRPEPGRPGQGALLRHPRPARARRHGGRLGRPVQRPGRHDADSVGAVGRRRRSAARAPVPLRQPEDPSQWGTL